MESHINNPIAFHRSSMKKQLLIFIKLVLLAGCFGYYYRIGDENGGSTADRFENN